MVNILHLRPQTQVLDDAVSTLLCTAKQPTFVTINYTDFWRVIPASAAYCLVCFKLPTRRAPEVPGLLREILSLPQYRTKRDRMGCVISWRNGVVADYCT
ncbi:MAG: hypothetical protein M3371_06860 [Acidobacteriota bacterium]|nr:hypothetical protein [Acidobacteriota bacterium]